jgi:hypothetical protein
MSLIKIKTGGNWRLLNGRGAEPVMYYILGDSFSIAYI